MNLRNLGNSLFMVVEGNDGAMKQFQGYLNDLINKSLGWLIGIGSALVIIWAMYIGVKFLTAKKADQRVEAKELLKQFILGLVLIFVLVVGAPLLIQALIAWAQSSNGLNGV